jgi:oxygen-independent coproporphyrinogen-3 oxidase
VKRCGYCDFNTYTPNELKSGSDSIQSVSQGYIDALLGEIALAKARLGDRQISTIFFGGGTPTLLPAEHLGQVLRALDDTFGLASDCEITTEANPDSVNARSLEELRSVGFNRISFGVQSVKSHVLRVLDRTHDSERVGEVVTAAKQAGFSSISIDLIYGTPGESARDFVESVDYALSLPIDHLSAYALIVEQGTKFGAAVRRGDVVMPNDDETAEKYLMLDEQMSKAGFPWYELSNWSKPGYECRHNQAYWLSADWWGLGAGAHSHLDGERWWNIKHPGAYIEAASAANSPAAGSEVLSESEREVERVMLQIRMRGGLALKEFTEKQRVKLGDFYQRGLLIQSQWDAGRAELSVEGRLLADQVVRELIS